MKHVLLIFIGLILFANIGHAQQMPNAIYTSKDVSDKAFDKIIKSLGEAKYSIQFSDKAVGSVRASLAGMNTTAVTITSFNSDGTTFIQANFNTKGAAGADMAKLLGNALKNNFPDLVTDIRIK
ncbi:MAG TPA: hypothetical protein VKH37_02445 [Ferruginibacter sp.]|nr:hypothetical protein [Ferruginibacter sp.]